MQYRYTARTASGDLVRGRLLAADLESATSGLLGRAFFVTSLQPVRGWDLRSIPLLRPGAGRARAAFFRSLATLVRAGIPLRRGLQVAIERGRGDAFASTLRDVLVDIERGDALSVAFARRPQTFSAVVVAMVAAGETGGILDDVLERIAAILERDDAVRKSVAGALAYPAAVLCATMALLVFLIVRVVPTFAALFASLRVDLPPSTRVLLALGDWASSPHAWAISLVLAAMTAGAGVVVAGTERWRYHADQIRLGIPLVGALLRKAIVARFARMLGTLIHSGIELSAALDVVLPVTGSPVHARALQRVSTALREGEALAPPLAATGLFDPLLVALVGIGEETGMLDELLPKVAEYFEDDVAAAVATLGAVLEPALIVILGAAVGTIVYSVYVPLYSLIGSVSK
jgi:type IV pilus assembly protein PilC